MNTFFTSDTHIGHKSLVKGISKWPDSAQCRDFDTVEEMDETIINNINAVVKPGDILYHAGDVCLGNSTSLINFMNRLNCKNVHLFLGNHDHKIMSKPDNRKLFIKVREAGKIKINNQDIIINHFPELIWNKHHHGSILLYGHCHGSLIGNKLLDEIFHKRKCMDIGIDTHPEFRPYHFDEIMKIMSTRDVKFLDHHQH